MSRPGGGGSGQLEIQHKILARTGQWWVINTSPTATAATLTVYTVLEGTSDQAYNYPGGGGVSGPYRSLAAADKVAYAEPLNAPVQTGPGGVITVSPGGGTSVNVSSGLAQIGDFFARLGQASTWIRVAEVLLGLGLIVVGLAKIASGTAVGKAAVKVGETAAIL